MNKYPKYKPSNIQWFGDIPENWVMKKLSHGFKKIGSGTTPESGNDDYYNGTYNWLQTGDLTDGEINLTSKKITKKALDNYTTLRFYKPNSVVIAMYGATIGKAGILNIETTTNQACCVLSEPISFFSKYVLYWFNSNKNHIISLSYGGGQPNISQETIKSLRIPCPSIEEQTAIANYLDQKTSQLAALIANKQKLIELLKEERTAIINEAVSGKGKNWERKKLKYVAEIVLGKMLTNEDKGGYYLKPYLRAANMQWLLVDVTDVKEMWFSPNELEKLRIKENDLLVSEGGEVGRTCIWKNELDECFIQNSVHKISFKKDFNPYFFYQFYYLGSFGFFESIVNKISIAHLTGEKIREIFVSFPSYSEQSEIVKHIQTENLRIENTVLKIEKEINLLQEYKVALISEVVTGKVKVI